jgi:glycosyltransferase involved in cell wall biosynthesis
MDNKNKSVLLISHAFPPGGKVEVHRVTEFAKHLSEFGWDTYVLTINSKSNSISENSIEVPSSINKIKRTPLILQESFPIMADAGLRWTPTLATNAVNMIKKYNIDIVFHTCPVFLPSIAVYYIKYKTELPYVLDFRDPWSLAKMAEDDFISKKKMYDFVSNIFESQVLEKLDAAVMNTAELRDEYIKKYPNQSSKFHVIYNGYDSNEVNNVKSNSNNIFQMIYPGKFRHDMRDFFTGCKIFVDKYPNTKFIHYGEQNWGYTPAVKDTVDKLDLEDYVEFRGYVRKSAAIKSITESNVGVVVTREGDRTHIPAKIFDYIGCNIPIICIDESNGAAANFVSKFENGYSVERGNPEDVFEILEDIYTRENVLTKNSELQEQYSRKSQAGDLSELLTRMI